MSSCVYLLRSSQQILQHLDFFKTHSAGTSPSLVLLSDALFYAEAFLELGCKVYALEADIDLVGLKSERVEFLSYVEFTILIESFDKIVSFS